MKKRLFKHTNNVLNEKASVKAARQHRHHPYQKYPNETEQAAAQTILCFDVK
jgi:hypothetical protein